MRLISLRSRVQSSLPHPILISARLDADIFFYKHSLDAGIRSSMNTEEKARLEALKTKGAERTAEENTEFEVLLTKALEAEQNTEQQLKYSEAYVKQLRDEAAKARIKAKQLEEEKAKYDGVDLEELNNWKKEREEAEKRKMEEKGEFSKMREQLIELHKSDLAKVQSAVVEKETRISTLESELNKTILANEVSNAAAVAKAWNPRLVEMVVMQNARIDILENGQRVVRVLDPDGSIKIDVKSGQPMTIPQYIERMKNSDEYASLFAGARVGGSSNSSNTFNGNVIQNPWKKESRNLTLQAKIMDENPNLATRMKEEAGVR